MAQNGQLVAGDDAALERLADCSRSSPFVRAITPYTAADKALPGPAAQPGRTEVVVSTVAGRRGRGRPRRRARGLRRTQRRA